MIYDEIESIGRTLEADQLPYSKAVLARALQHQNRSYVVRNQSAMSANPSYHLAALHKSAVTQA